MKAMVPVLVMLSAALLASAPASAWVVDLPDSLSAGTGLVRLSDLSLTQVLPDAAGIVIADGGAPGETTLVTRQGVLRRLVVAGLAANVQLTGAMRCVIRFGGGNLAPETLQAEAERVVARLLPAAPKAPRRSGRRSRCLPARCRRRVPGRWTANGTSRCPRAAASCDWCSRTAGSRATCR